MAIWFPAPVLLHGCERVLTSDDMARMRRARIPAVLNVVGVDRIHKLMAHFAAQRDRAKKAGAPIAAGVLQQVLDDFDRWLEKLATEPQRPRNPKPTQKRRRKP